MVFVISIAAVLPSPKAKTVVEVVRRLINGVVLGGIVVGAAVVVDGLKGIVVSGVVVGDVVVGGAVVAGLEGVVVGGIVGVGLAITVVSGGDMAGVVTATVVVTGRLVGTAILKLVDVDSSFSIVEVGVSVDVSLMFSGSDVTSVFVVV